MMRSMRGGVSWRLGAAVPVLILGLALAGCGGGNDPVSPPSKVEQGWSAFQKGDFTAAQDFFESALTDDPTDPEAHNGLGWVQLKGLDDLAAAIQSFDSALANGFAEADPNVGKALALRDLEPVDYGAAIACAQTALTKEPNFVFDHHTSLDWHDVRLVLAGAFYATGDYTSAYAEVTALGGNTLDTAGPRFIQQLLVEIDRLSRLYAG